MTVLEILNETQAVRARLKEQIVKISDMPEWNAQDQIRKLGLMLTAMHVSLVDRLDCLEKAVLHLEKGFGQDNKGVKWLTDTFGE